MSYLTSFWTSSEPASACLRGTDKDLGAHGYLEAGGWTVPLLWSMCFGGADVHVEELPENEWPEPEQRSFGASCDASIDAAIARLERRIPFLKVIVAPELHGACDLFVARLRESREKFVHADLSLLLENEDDPSDGAWKKYWGGLVDGLDAPVTRVRSGIAAKLLGLGLPSDWKYAGFWALSNTGPLSQLRSPDLDIARLTGAHDVRGLCLWQA